MQKYKKIISFTFFAEDFSAKLEMTYTHSVISSGAKRNREISFKITSFKIFFVTLRKK